MKRTTPNVLAGLLLACGVLLLAGCAGSSSKVSVGHPAAAAAESSQHPRAPRFSTQGVLDRLPPLDTTGLTEEQIAEAEAARYRKASLQAFRERQRRRERTGGAR
ncbi:MAG: hypothetical protein AAF333_09340 [Planctomycetota bacterium]